jgi:hypothetical protein
MRRPCKFKQTDVTRVVKALLAAGVEVARIIVEDGRIIAVPRRPAEAQDANAERNEWDDEA